MTVKGVYCSFWPDGAAGHKKDFTVKRSQPGSMMQSIDDDIANENGVIPKTIELHGLDEEAVLEFVRGVQRNLPRYQLVRHNCSHVVAGALIAGSGRKPSFIPHAGRYHPVGRLGVGVWTPDQVLKFARELATR